MIVPVKNKTKSVAYKIFKSMRKSTMEYIYRGHFNTEITDTILTLTSNNLEKDNVEKKIRKRVFFIIIEGLQNITRHQSNDNIKELSNYPGLFSVQYKVDGYYITTGNVINKEDINIIKTQINKINKLNKLELKQYSLEILKKGEFSTKGGAGLGLIEMARKSGCKLYYEFIDINKKYAFFYLQTKIIGIDGSKQKADNDKSLISLISRHKILEKQSILLNFVGAFTQETLVGLLAITEKQLKGNIIIKVKAFNLMVEVLQNIVNHAEEYTINNIRGKHAIFYIKDSLDYLYFTSGNYIKNSDIKSLETKLENVNKLNEKQLIKNYKKTLLSIDKESDINPGLGIIDIRIRSNSPIEYDFFQIDETYSFFTLKIQINKMKKELVKYFISEQDDTPEVYLDPKGIINFKGKSIPENAVSLYKPIIDWLNTYKNEPADITEVSINFDYYNTATDRQLVKILLILEELNKNNTVKVDWFYNTGDISMLNDGNKFKELIELDINIVEIVDEDE